MVTRCVWASLLLCGACGDDVASEDQLHFSAPTEATDVADHELVVVWSVSSGNPDYNYAWGRGSLTDSTLGLQLSSRPPADAMNRFGVGVAHLVAFEAGVDPGEGKVDFDPLVPRIVGVSARYAIIYVDAPQRAAFKQEVDTSGNAELQEDYRDHWSLDFPAGYACAKGEEKKPGQIFDTFEPVDCSKLRMFWGKLGDADLVDWT